MYKPTLTHAAVVIAVAYMVRQGYALYKIAVPTVPPLVDERGNYKPTLSPLWGSSDSQTLALSVSLLTSPSPPADFDKRSEGAAADGTTLRMLHYTGNNLRFNDTFNLDLVLDLTEAGTGLKVTCIPEADADWCHTLARKDSHNGQYVLGEWSNVGEIAAAVQQGSELYSYTVLRLQRPPPSATDAELSVRAITPLVQQSDYVPPKPLHYLWEDVWGDRTLVQYEAARRAATVPARLPARTHSKQKRVNLRPLPLPSREGVNGTLVHAPEAGKPWPHFVSQVDLKLVMDTTVFPKQEIPQAVQHLIIYDHTYNHYLPRLIANPVRPVQDRYVPLNNSATQLPLRITLQQASFGTWHLLHVLDSSITTQQSMGATSKDTDDVIRLFSDTPLWLLGLTMIVSFVHLLFDALALKNDVSFWASTSSLRGISVNALVIEFVTQAIITTYLVHGESSLLILIPQVASTCLLVAKIVKASGIRWRLWLWVVPLPYMDTGLAATAQQGKTKEYDREAIQYMSVMMGPLLVGFVLYTFLYERYSGWGDWALSASVGAVYAFGFIMMTPQLWINYKMRSVAHLPWDVLMYRFFNTIIDDLFASIIKMPTMHRISVFRDDVIFIVYMYQRWLYPVDASRPAEGYDTHDADTSVPSLHPVGDTQVAGNQVADSGTADDHAQNGRSTAS